jgi:hypothetical protein
VHATGTWTAPLTGLAGIACEQFLNPDHEGLGQIVGWRETILLSCDSVLLRETVPVSFDLEEMYFEWEP